MIEFQRTPNPRLSISHILVWTTVCAIGFAMTRNTSEASEWNPGARLAWALYESTIAAGGVIALGWFWQRKHLPLAPGEWLAVMGTLGMVNWTQLPVENVVLLIPLLTNKLAIWWRWLFAVWVFKVCAMAGISIGAAYAPGLSISQVAFYQTILLTPVMCGLSVTAVVSDWRRGYRGGWLHIAALWLVLSREILVLLFWFVLLAPSLFW